MFTTVSPQRVQNNGLTAETAVPITQLSATELAAQIATGRITAVEAVEAHITRIEQTNPHLNAVVVKRYEAARAEAREADARRARGEKLGPLHGVPVTIKECLDVTGTPSTFGLASRASHRAEKDDVYVARLRQAGAIVLGKTNVAQLLVFTETDNPVYGRTNNPWNVNRSPGGSSGGEGAIIAAGGSPLGLGTDIGGSVRFPAALCGITSLKPTAGRVPDNGRFSVPIGQQAVASQVGVLARQVADLSLALKIINGDHPVPLGNPETVDLTKLRVAYFVEDGVFPVAPAVRRAVLETADWLKKQGIHVSAWNPPDVIQAIHLFYGLLTADAFQGLKAIIGRDKKDPRVAMLAWLTSRSRPTLFVLEKLLKLVGQSGLATLLPNLGHRHTHHYWQLVEAQIAYKSRFQESLNSSSGGPFDLILCPIASLPAFTHGATRDMGVAGGYSILYNVLGYPAGVVPLTRVQPGEEVGRKPSKDLVEKAALQVEMGSAGLPVSIQIAARPWQEHKALAMMQFIQTMAQKRPDYPAHPPL